MRLNQAKYLRPTSLAALRKPMPKGTRWMPWAAQCNCDTCRLRRASIYVAERSNPSYSEPMPVSRAARRAAMGEGK